MRQALRRLERSLVRERAELHARAVIDEFLPRWIESPDSDFSIEFAQRLGECGMHLRFPQALNYLIECRIERSEPDTTKLLQILLP